MKNNLTPKMTADKAHWSAIATATTSVVLYLSGVGKLDVEGFSESLAELLTLLAAGAIQAAVIWATTYYKRNLLK